MSHKNLARQALPGNCRLRVRRSQPGCASHGYMAVCQAVGRIPAQFQRNRHNSAQTARNRRNSAQFGALGAIRRKWRIPAHSSAFGAFQRTRRNPAHGQLRPLSPHALQYSDGMGNFGDIVMIPKQVTCRARAKGFKGSDIRKCMDMSMLLESPGFVQGAPSVLYLHMSPQRSWRGQLFLLWCACLMPLGGIGVKTFSGHFDTQLCQDTRAMQDKSCTQRLSLACSRTSPRFSSHPRASQARAAQSSKIWGFGCNLQEGVWICRLDLGPYSPTEFAAIDDFLEQVTRTSVMRDLASSFRQSWLPNPAGYILQRTMLVIQELTFTSAEVVHSDTSRKHCLCC